MKIKSIFALAFALATLGTAQPPPRTFDWVRASDEIVQLDPGDYFSGRVYRPGGDGGNMHIIVQSRLPVTIAMAPAEEWNAATQHPESVGTVDYRCMREHITSTTYECHLPPNRPMVLVMYDERRADRVVFRGIDAVLHRNAARLFIAPNDVKVTYHSWSCVAHCEQPEFRWIRLAKEKYEVTTIPKMYGMAAPENDGQKVWVNIKAPLPMTLAVVPSNVADQVYDHPETLSAVLSKTACKQRGVQKMQFTCTFNMADGPQSLLVLPEPPFKLHKKAELEVQTYRCVENCNLLVSDGNQ